MKGRVEMFKENLVDVFGLAYRKVKSKPRTHRLHWEATPMVMRKPAWGSAVNVTISQDVLIKKMLHHARLLSPHLMEVGFMVEKLVPCSHGSQ